MKQAQYGKANMLRQQCRLVAETASRGPMNALARENDFYLRVLPTLQIGTNGHDAWREKQEREAGGEKNRMHEVLSLVSKRTIQKGRRRLVAA